VTKVKTVPLQNANTMSKRDLWLWRSVGIFGIIAIFIWAAVFRLGPRSTLRFHVFDIGQGDALFIETPDRYQILIDGGPDGRVVHKLGSVMPFWDRKIDLVILTHPHADHLSGLIDVLRRYRVGAIIESGAIYNTPEIGSWRREKEKQGLRSIAALAGITVSFGRDTTLKILSPLANVSGRRFSNVHEADVVSELFYGSTTILLTGDAEEDLETDLIRRHLIAPVQILKVGHHGSRTSTSDLLLKTVRPEIAVISVGAKNSYGHPRAEILERLKSFGIRIFRTDESGDLVFESDGTKVMADAR